MWRMESSSLALNDDALLRRYAAHGDPGAFAELVRRYAGMVYSTSRRVTRDGHLAEDVAQDCFLRMAEKSASITGSVAAWLHRTALNRSLEFLRSERARKLRETKFAAGDAQGVETPLESAELIARVDSALETLPDELRVPLVEHYLCGKGQGELASALGVNQSTISRRIEKGLTQLRASLASAGVTASLVMLPEMLNSARMASPPPPELTSTLSKIGLAGIRESARSAASPGIKIAVALLLATTILGGLAVYLTRPRIAAPVTVFAPGIPAAAAAPATRNEDDEMEMQGIMPELPSADIPAAMKFYQDVLGFKVSYGDGKGYTILKRDETQIALLPKQPPFVGPTSVYIFVQKIDQYFDEVKAKKPTFRHELATNSYGMRDFSLLDPEGNRISFGEEVKKSR